VFCIPFNVLIVRLYLDSNLWRDENKDDSPF